MHLKFILPSVCKLYPNHNWRFNAYVRSCNCITKRKTVNVN